MENRYDFEILSNKILENADLPHEAVALYGIIRTLFYNKASQCSKVNLSTLYDLLSIDSRQSTQTKVVKSALTDLKEIGSLSYIKNSFNREIDIYSMKNNIIYDFGFAGLDEDSYYTKIEPWAMLKILEYLKESSLENSSLDKVEKYKFIRFFLIILKYTNGYLYWQISNSLVNIYMTIGDESIAKYKDILETLELFYITRDYYGFGKDGKTFKTLPTFYGNRCIKDKRTNDYLSIESFYSEVESHLSQNRVKYIKLPGLKEDKRDKDIEEKKEIETIGARETKHTEIFEDHLIVDDSDYYEMILKIFRNFLELDEFAQLPRNLASKIQTLKQHCESFGEENPFKTIYEVTSNIINDFDCSKLGMNTLLGDKEKVDYIVRQTALKIKDME